MSLRALSSQIKNPLKLTKFVNGGSYNIGCNVYKLDCDVSLFDSIKDSFNDLGRDDALMSQKGLSECTRYRRFRIVQIEKTIKGNYGVIKSDSNEYIQNVEDGDYRRNPRKFELIDDALIDCDIFQAVLIQMMQFANDEYNLHSSPFNLQLKIHQVRQVTTAENVAENAPEGIHQDGEDFVLPALIIDKENLCDNSAITQIYDKSKNFLNETVLSPGQGTLHNDREYFHYATPAIIKNSNENNGFGRRDSFGLDFTFVD